MPSRRKTSTPRRTPAGSPTWRSRSARSSGSTRQALKRVELGALFHDIGKIGIPAAILTKPGPLTDEERAADRDPSRARRAHPRSDRAARARPADRPRLPRALRRKGYPDRLEGRRDPARGPDHLRLRRIPRDDHDAALPHGAPDRRSEEAPDRVVRNRSSIPAIVEVCLRVFEAPSEAEPTPSELDAPPAALRAAGAAASGLDLDLAAGAPPPGAPASSSGSAVESSNAHRRPNRAGGSLNVNASCQALKRTRNESSTIGSPVARLAPPSRLR